MTGARPVIPPFRVEFTDEERAEILESFDFKLLAAAVNLARLATLGLRSTSRGWQLQPA